MPGLSASQNPRDADPPIEVWVDTGDGHGPRLRFKIEANPNQPIVDCDFRAVMMWLGHYDPALSPAGTQFMILAPPGDTSAAISIFAPGSTATGATLQFGRDGRVTSLEYFYAKTPGKGLLAHSPDGTRYVLSPPNGGGAAIWVPH